MEIIIPDQTCITLKELIKKAIQTDKWLYSSFDKKSYSPAELVDLIKNGTHNHGSAYWKLVNFPST